VELRSRRPSGPGRQTMTAGRLRSTPCIGIFALFTYPALARATPNQSSRGPAGDVHGTIAYAPTTVGRKACHPQCAMAEDSEKAALIKVGACGVCGTDLHILKGHWPKQLPWPFTLGHEIGGVLVEVGSEFNEDFMSKKLEVGSK